MLKSAFKLTLVFITSWSIFSCSTDVDLNAPYIPTTVVYGLLNPGLDTQWVRINKTFLGDGNNLVYATIRDSSEYDFSTFEAKISEVKFGNVVDEWILDSITRNDKSTDGIFFSPSYTAYYFVSEGGLDRNSEYRLDVDFTNKNDVSSSTTLIKTQSGSVSQPPDILPPNAPFLFSFSSNFGGNVIYNDLFLKWTSTENAKRYEVAIRTHYTEQIWADTEHTELVAENVEFTDWNIGTVKASDASGGDLLSKEVNGELFYKHLKNSLEASPYITRVMGVYDASVSTVRVCDFILTIADDELNTFLDVNEPVTGVIQERPEYTNINGGLGLFASRAVEDVSGVGMSLMSVQELIEGQHTADLNFCFPDPSPSYDAYNCD